MRVSKSNQSNHFVETMLSPLAGHMTVTIEQNIQTRSSNIGIIQIITADAENQYNSAHNNPGLSKSYYIIQNGSNL